ncbi:MAG: hypothetical protein GY716_14330 [bacterium]|nr:hypothetical protein [bacterium]
MAERMDTMTMRRLTLQEIDERMQRLVEEVTAVSPAGEPPHLARAAVMEPRWIDPAALVRRLRPFISNN